MRVSRIACVAVGAAAAISLAFCLPTMSFADDAPQTGSSELAIEDAGQGDQENPVTEVRRSSLLSRSRAPVLAMSCLMRAAL